MTYLRLHAGAKDPLFTTYAAPMTRSRFFADKAYFMDYFTPDKPITYSSQYAGDLAVVWKFNNVVISSTRDFARPPVVVASFPDMAVLEYEPFAGVKVQETFCVYSSGLCCHRTAYGQHRSRSRSTMMVYPLVHLPADSMRVVRYDAREGGYLFAHHEDLVRLHSNLYKDRGYPTGFRNLLSAVPAPESYGAYDACSLDEFYFAIKRLSKVHENVTALNQAAEGPADIVDAAEGHRPPPGRETDASRFVRSVSGCRQNRKRPCSRMPGPRGPQICSSASTTMWLSSGVSRGYGSRRDAEKLVYIGAFNLVRQCMLPPMGQTSRNFYVFSRNPVWGWGHGHQVMHESLSMIPYVYLDARSAEESQRIYMDQQYEDGLIAYRHGPRGPQVYPHEGVPTTSAPFFCVDELGDVHVSRRTGPS